MKLFTLHLLAALLLISCGSKSKMNPKALAVYLAKLNNLRKSDLEESAVSAFRAVSGRKDKGDKALYQALSRCILPNYTEFYTRLYQIKPVDPALSNLHYTYTEGAKYQLLAFSNVSEYLISQDKADLRRFKKLSRHAQSLINKWEKTLKIMLQKSGKKL